ATPSNGCCSPSSSSTCGGARCAPPTSTRSPIAARRCSGRSAAPRTGPLPVPPPLPTPPRPPSAPLAPPLRPPSAPLPPRPLPGRPPRPLTRTCDRARSPPPRRTRLHDGVRPLPRGLHRGGHRPAGAVDHHGDALRRLRRRHLVLLGLPVLGPGLLGVVPDPRPHLHDLRGAGLRPLDEDAL